MAQQALAAPQVERRVSMTYQEWLRWPESLSRRSEWVDGEAIVFMPPKTVHALVATFLARLLGSFVDLFDLGRKQVAFDP
jgi:Uma2 family endonuclease